MPPAERAALMLALEREQEERGNRSSSSASSHHSTTVDKRRSASSSDSSDSSTTDDEERPKNPQKPKLISDKPADSDPSGDSESDSTSSDSEGGQDNVSHNRGHKFYNCHHLLDWGKAGETSHREILINYSVSPVLFFGYKTGRGGRSPVRPTMSSSPPPSQGAPEAEANQNEGKSSMPPANRAAHLLALEPEQEERDNLSCSSASSYRSTTVDKNGSASSSDSNDS